MIAHFLASHPNTIPFFSFGFLWAFGANFGRQALQGCLFGAFYLYVFGAFSLFVFILLLSDPDGGQIFFLLGFLTFHIKLVFSWISTAFFWILEKNREWKEAEERAQWEKEQVQHSHQQQTRDQQDRAEQVRREQEQREREARQYREQQERTRQEQAQKKSQNQQQEKPKEPPPKKPEPRDTRTPEQILGLAIGYTQNDLKTAYKRESQRLHPEAIQKAMEAEFKAVQEAYKRLKK